MVTGGQGDDDGWDGDDNNRGMEMGWTQEDKWHITGQVIDNAEKPQ